MRFYRRRRGIRHRRHYRRRRHYRGRRFRKRGGFRGIVPFKTTIRKLPYLMPDSLKMIMKWTETVTPTDVAGQFTLRYFINSPYQPKSSAATSVLGWNQYTPFYERYYCCGSKIQVQFLNNDVDVGLAAVYPSRNDASVSNIDEALTQPYARSGYLMSPNVAPRGTRINCRMSIRKLEGYPPFDSAYTALVDASPANLRYWFILGDTFDGEVNNVLVKVTLWYTVRFYSRLPLSESVIS